jgi:hypothetical protein
MLLTKTTRPAFALPDPAAAEYKVSAVDVDGAESFTSEPLWVPAGQPLQVEMETVAAAASLPYVNYSGEGFVEISNSRHTSLEWTVDIPQEGRYLIDIRYSNGSGPWNTDNKCALRSLYVNERYAGSMVFPQRGRDEWSEWGYSNARIVALQPGVNRFRLVLEPWNTNMNVEVNTAMLDVVRLIRLP